MISTKELSKKLGIHKNTIYNYVKQGLPVIKLKQKMLFNYDEVIVWLTERSEK